MCGATTPDSRKKTTGILFCLFTIIRIIYMFFFIFVYSVFVLRKKTICPFGGQKGQLANQMLTPFKHKCPVFEKVKHNLGKDV